MSCLEVKVSQSNNELKTIEKNVISESTASLLDALKHIKEETNEFLTTLVESNKTTDEAQLKKADKRISCETLEGGDTVKKRIGCQETNRDENDSESADEEDD